MTYPKLVFLFGLTLVSTFAGCGGGDSDDGSGDDDSSSDGTSNGTTSSTGSNGSDAGGSGGSGGTTGDSGGTGGSSTTGGSTNNTSGTTGGGDGNACGMGMGMPDSDECTDYNECAQRECGSEYAECMGDDFASGDFSGGTCESMFECLQGCTSGDTCDFNCAGDCFGEASNPCTDCLLAAGACGEEACADEYEACNADPSTTTTGTTTAGTTGGGGGTCEDLEACCNSLDGDEQAGCLDGLEASEASGDQACDIILQIYQAGGICTDG